MTTATIKSLGEWQFRPQEPPGGGTVYHNTTFDGHYVAFELMRVPDLGLFVRGAIRHRNHGTIRLRSWHRALFVSKGGEIWAS